MGSVPWEELALIATALMRGKPWRWIPVEWVQETGEQRCHGRLEGLCPVLCVLGRLVSRKPGAAGGALLTSQTLGFRKFGLGAEGFKHRNGALAKQDWLPMNGGPAQGQW